MKTTTEPYENEPEGDPSVQSETEILEEAVKRFKAALDYESENRDLAEDDVDFRHGDQWPDSIRQQREQDQRPCLTFNKMEGRVDQVVGDQRQAKPSIGVYPADVGSDKKAPNMTGTSDYALSQVMNGLIRAIEQNSDAQIAYNTGFDHAVGHGFGYWRIITEWDLHDPFQQVIRIHRIKNSFSVYLDPLAQQPHGGDAEWGFISSMMDKEAFKRKYPKAETQSWTQSGQGDEYEHWFEGDNVRIAEYFRKVKVKKIAALLSDERVVHVDDENMLANLADDLKADKQTVTKWKWVEVPKVEWFKLSAGDVLETPREFPSFYIPIVRVVGKELNVRGYDYFRGIIRHAKDAQRSYNFERTAQAEITALQPKAPWMLTAEQLGPYKTLYERANKDSVPYLLYVHQEGVIHPTRQPPPLPASGNIANAQGADADIDATTGQYESGRGEKSNEKSGKAIQARELSGDVANYAYHDNLHLAIKQTGLILVDMIPRIYDTPRTERILTLEDEDDYIKLNQKVIDSDGKISRVHDLAAGRYDVRVATGPSYTSLREEARNSMLEFAQALPNVGALISDMIAENMDWPKKEAIAERLRKTLPPGLVDEKDGEKQEITEQDVQMAVEQAVQQFQQESGQQMEQMELQIKEMAAQSKAETDEYKAITDRMGVMQDAIDNDERVKDLVAQSLAELIQQEQRV